MLRAEGSESELVKQLLEKWEDNREGRMTVRAKGQSSEGIVECVEAVVRGQVMSIRKLAVPVRGKDGRNGSFSYQIGIFQTPFIHLSSPYFFFISNYHPISQSFFFFLLL